MKMMLLCIVEYSVINIRLYVHKTPEIITASTVVQELLSKALMVIMKKAAQ